MRSLGYSALLGWLVHFILNSSVSNQTESQADISHAHARVPRRKQAWFQSGKLGTGFGYIKFTCQNPRRYTAWCGANTG